MKIFLFKCLFNNENKNYLEFLESIKGKNDFQRLLNHDEFNNLFSVKDNKHTYNYFSTNSVILLRGKK